MRQLRVLFTPLENDDPNVIGKILIEPGFAGEISAGQYGKGKPQPHFTAEIVATGPDGTSYEEIKRGNADSYSLIYRFENRKGSPIFATVRRDDSTTDSQE